ncbi:MAG: LPS export ABC transporter periplasmic protein LptC [Pseudomonas sp.]|jgi:lipopolysaccharide export system protein LptC|uniref:LPS export ABC transporter periplasmic protein LptC n=1 Tax=Halopseudomonas TaxID=2901189 RepID=UPI001B437A95|nr:LPS export ABC transporter periplasmic protein LptC [Pseudomonas sp.]MBQ0778657.1 LPS export ABC transporter periplasmic protein LptC [Pseudomonas sp.]WOD10638.1 LPS export ABC transporter periplasmic protein LptC [Pseudomonas sp. NyZ704]
MPTIPKIPRYLLTAGFIGLAVVLGLSIGYFNIRPASFNDSLTISDPNQPDFFMENNRILMLNEQGTPAYELTSVRATHQANDDSTKLESPRLIFYRAEDGEPWLLEAEHGVVTQAGDQVELTDNVLLQSQNPAQSDRRMTTQALTLFPARNYAETAQSVRIENANNVTNAVGMQVYLNDGRLELLSTVRGQHEVR